MPVGIRLATPGFSEEKKSAAPDEGPLGLSLDALLSLRLTTDSFLDLDLANSPFSMTIIDKQQIENPGARHLSELLEIHVPGFQYMINKWNGVIWGMRGIAPDRNTKFIFLVNGHKLNSQALDGALSKLTLGLHGDIGRVWAEGKRSRPMLAKKPVLFVTFGRCTSMRGCPGTASDPASAV